jgi:Cdc6-like AAA superfamily ATPase
LIRDCDFVLPLSQRLAADEQTFIRLTSKQASTFRLFQINDKILVKGIAGSGKTLIAKEVAQEFYEKGLNVLFLCYNKVLALNIESYFRKGKKVDVSSFLEDPELDSESLTDKVKLKDFAILIEKLRKTSGVDKSKNSIRVERYHSFAYSVIEANDPGWWWGNVSNPDFWNFLISCKLENIKNTGGISPYYDVIIIDEGQDFMEYWYETAKYFQKPEGKFYVFMDEMQNINQACPRIPGLKEFTIASLTENCRNTKNIASELSGIIRQEIKSMDEMPLGEGVVHIRYKNDTDQQTKILSEIKKLTGEKGISPD